MWNHLRAVSVRSMWLQRVRSSLLTDLAQKEPFMNSPESNKNRRCFNPPVMLNISAEWAWHSKTKFHYFYRVFPFMTSFRLPRAISLHLFSHHHEVVKLLQWTDAIDMSDLFYILLTPPLHLHHHSSIHSATPMPAHHWYGVTCHLDHKLTPKKA